MSIPTKTKEKYRIMCYGCMCYRWISRKEYSNLKKVTCKKCGGNSLRVVEVFGCVFVSSEKLNIKKVLKTGKLGVIK